MRIAHISDLHICAENKPENISRTEQLLQAAASSDTDHLVITGDISHDANTNDLSILRSLLIKYRFLHWSKLSVVIGNHDIFGGIHFAEDIVKFPQKCMQTDYDEKVEKFVYYFRESFMNTFQPLINQPFPYFKTIKDFLFIGINSIASYSKYWNPLASNGKVSYGQHEMIKKTLSSIRFKDKIKIALVHHHFMPKLIYNEHQRHGLWNLIEQHSMKLYGKHKILKTFARHNLNLVLHGHVHENNRYQRKGIRFINGGATVDDSKRQNLSINFIHIDMEGIQVDTKKILSDDTVYQEFPVTNDIIPQLAG